MSPAYIDAVTTHLPGVRLVFDRFHVIKLYNDKLSELRRALYRELTDTMQKDVLKGDSLAVAQEAGKPRSCPQGTATP